jgi:hypothetical protein
MARTLHEPGLNQMRRDLERMASGDRTPKNVRVITICGSIGEFDDPDGGERDHQELLAEARKRFPDTLDNVVYVVARVFFTTAGGPRIIDSWAKPEEVRVRALPPRVAPLNGHVPPDQTLKSPECKLCGVGGQTCL